MIPNASRAARLRSFWRRRLKQRRAPAQEQKQITITTMSLLQQRIRHGTSIIALLALLPFFIIAQEAGKLEIMNCLRGSPVYVSSIYLTCDSAGAYYYGKSSYRDSATCKYDDTARIKANLELQKDFTNDSIMVSVDVGVYGILSPAIDATDFCPISMLSTTDDSDNNNNDDSYSCPSLGFYVLKTSFKVSSFEVDKNFHYIPDVRLRLYNGTGMSVIGCAQTGTMYTYDTSRTRATMGLVALGISMLVLGTCSGIMLYLTYRRKKRLEQELKDKRSRHEIPYVRTTARGRVVVPMNAGSSKSSQDSSDV